MINLVTVLGIASIGLGAVCVWLAFWAFMTNRPRVISVVCGLCALVLLTIIPVTLAVAFATRMN